ncbi:MAG: T9SS type A sorting domain-containing protein [bacterium]
MMIQSKNILLYIILLVASVNLWCETRYVSKAGGSSAPPYTTWETACDSLQKCFDFCVSGDTIYVDRGIYRETIYIQDKDLTIIGVDTDECILDGTGIDGKINKFILFYSDSCNVDINNLTLKKRKNEESISYYALFIHEGNCKINDCIIDSTRSGIGMFKGCNISNLIIKNACWGLRIGTVQDNLLYKIQNSIFFIKSNESGPQCIYNSSGGGEFNITNNIFITDAAPLAFQSIELRSNQKVIISNNLFYGLCNAIRALSLQGGLKDTTYIYNNTIIGSPYGIETGNIVKHFKIKNNIFAHCYCGVFSYGNQGDVDYNMFYDNTGVTYINIPPGMHDITADPMFVKDTIVRPFGTYDFRLQKYSPAIDRGDPNILDIDGSRSDLGMFGGPLGEKYIYMDLAPKPVKGLKAVYEQDTNRVKLTWNKNTEYDFKQYNVYKDITANFTIDSTKRIAITTEPIFYDTLNKGILKVYYKITAIDSTENESITGTEVNVTINANEEVTIIENMEYVLYQNYPNPFNPNTTISYSLKEQGEVRIKLYTITGELIKTIIEGTKSKGYNETNIDLSGYTSGIYLYRIEVTGNGKIPVFNDLKKMVLLK